MSDDMEAISRMRAITISREYGSGGGEIAVRLAQRLGWQLVDHEVVVEVANALGVSEAEAEAHDEHVEGLASRLLRYDQRSPRRAGTGQGKRVRRKLGHLPTRKPDMDRCLEGGVEPQSQ